jgi:hypothetical protein
MDRFQDGDGALVPTRWAVEIDDSGDDHVRMLGVWPVQHWPCNSIAQSCLCTGSESHQAFPRRDRQLFADAIHSMYMVCSVAVRRRRLVVVVVVVVVVVPLRGQVIIVEALQVIMVVRLHRPQLRTAGDSNRRPSPPPAVSPHTHAGWRGGGGDSHDTGAGGDNGIDRNKN